MTDNVHTMTPEDIEMQDRLKGTFMFIQGDAVKIKRGDQRFWVIVEEISPSGKCIGTIDNDLIHTHKHDLSYGDTVTFTKSEILGVFKDPIC